MSLFAIGDTHLSFGTEKPMDIFAGWENHTRILKEAWCDLIRPEDTVVLAGDISWGMTMEEALPDFRWLDELPGASKIIVKGNHDYWWLTMKKMQEFMEQHQLKTLKILHNNCYAYEDFGICGTRGWVNMDTEEPANAKVSAREAQRLDVSLTAAVQQHLTPLVFLHYPPVYGASCNYEIQEVLWKHHVTDCWYGHVHGRSMHRYAINGERDGVHYHLISGDYVDFIPQKIR
ncbi:MAG: metallophosphoesterase family protein [Oscillospiraceae bacterium]|nr:metallophosphoesterase family protein [Oscillospiraceae bacterium]